jgi:hypothetical protein
MCVCAASLPTSQFDTLENSLHKVQRETHELHQQVSLLSGESGFNIDAAAKKVHSFSMRHNVDELLSTVKVRTRYITAQHSTAQHSTYYDSPVQSNLSVARVNVLCVTRRVFLRRPSTQSLATAVS